MCWLAAAAIDKFHPPPRSFFDPCEPQRPPASEYKIVYLFSHSPHHTPLMLSNLPLLKIPPKNFNPHPSILDFLKRGWYTISMKKICKKHGEHSEWRLRDRSSTGHGRYHECRYCHRERKQAQRKRQRDQNNYSLIFQHLGMEKAQEFKNTLGAKFSDYLYRGKGFTVSAKMISKLGVKSTKYKFMRLGEERALAFLRQPACEECGLEHEERSFFEIHHIIPRSKGGGNDGDNLIILCPNCHRQQHI